MTEPVRETRRTAVVTIDGAEEVRLCEKPCRDEFLLDLAVPGVVGRAQYRSRGHADVTVAWSGRQHRIDWHRAKPSALFCDLCGDEWRHVIPAAVANAERQKERWAALSDEEKASATHGLRPFSRSLADENPSGALSGTPRSK